VGQLGYARRCTHTHTLTHTHTHTHTHTLQVLPSKEGLLADFQEDVAGKEEPQLRRLINESEEIAGQRCVRVFVRRKGGNREEEAMHVFVRECFCVPACRRELAIVFE